MSFYERTANSRRCVVLAEGEPGERAHMSKSADNGACAAQVQCFVNYLIHTPLSLL